MNTRSVPKMLGVACLLTIPFVCDAVHALESATPTAMPFTLAKPALDVGLIVSDLDQASEFYGKALGLQFVSPTYRLPSAKTAAFRAGASTINLHELKPTPPRLQKGVMAVDGMRLLAILIQGSDATAKRFAAAGLKAPSFAAGTAEYKVAFVEDPDGNAIELVAFDGEMGPGARAGFQIGLTTSDAATMREFYGRILGFAERPALRLPDSLAANTTQYMFRAGASTVKFWAPPNARAPKAAGAMEAALGIRYLLVSVSDIEHARSELQARGAKIETSSSPDPGTKRFFIADPEDNLVQIVAAESSE